MDIGVEAGDRYKALDKKSLRSQGFQHSIYATQGAEIYIHVRACAQVHIYVYVCMYISNCRMILILPDR